MRFGQFLGFICGLDTKLKEKFAKKHWLSETERIES